MEKNFVQEIEIISTYLSTDLTLWGGQTWSSSDAWTRVCRGPELNPDPDLRQVPEDRWGQVSVDPDLELSDFFENFGYKMAMKMWNLSERCF